MNRRPAAPPAPTAGDPRTSPLDWARTAGAVEPVVRAIEKHACRRRRRRRMGAAGAALVVALLMGAVLRPPLPETAPAAVVTQPARQVLPDGTVIELRGDAAVAVEFRPGLRRVVLRRGEAHFAVVKDAARPFVVEAGGVGVRAVGTAFLVQHGTRGIEVLVTEGRVAVAANAMAAAGSDTFVGAGECMVVGSAAAQAPAGASAVSPDELRERLAWRVPRLEFNAAPLAEVLALFNRHSSAPGPVRLALADPALGKLPLSGVLRADNVGVLLAILDQSYGLKAERDPTGTLVLRRTR